MRTSPSKMYPTFPILYIVKPLLCKIILAGLCLTLKAPSKICSRRYSKKNFLHFRWTVCQADNSHEISRLVLKFFTFQVNCLPSRQFTWNIKTCFLWKIKRKIKNCNLLQFQQKTFCKIFFLFYPENRLWHFMQIIQGMSNPIFCEK